MDTSTWQPNEQRGAEIFLNGVSKNVTIQSPHYFNGDPLNVKVHLKPDCRTDPVQVVLYLQLDDDGDTSFITSKSTVEGKRSNLGYAALKAITSTLRVDKEDCEDDEDDEWDPHYIHDENDVDEEHDEADDYNALVHYLYTDLLKDEWQALRAFDKAHDHKNFIEEWLENDEQKDDQRRRSEH